MADKMPRATKATSPTTTPPTKTRLSVRAPPSYSPSIGRAPTAELCSRVAAGVLSGGRLSGSWVCSRSLRAVAAFSSQDCVTKDYEGYRVHRFTDGSVFSGEWVGGCKKGLGVLQLADGSVYEGEFSGDVFSGLGRISHESGSKFIGQFGR